MSGGRPTKYDPAFCDMAEAELGNGMSLAAFAGEIGVHRDTVYEWIGLYDDFSDAVKRGRAKGQAAWERRLASLAVTGSGNATAIIFAMKNLYREDWNDRVVTEHAGKVQTEEVGNGAAKVAAFLDAISSRAAGSPAAE